MLLILIYLIVFVMFSRLYGIKNYYSPLFLFFVFQIIMFIGSVKYYNYSLKPDQITIMISFLVLVSLVFGSFTFKMYIKPNTKKINKEEFFIENSPLFNLLIVGMLIFSTLISLIYYRAIGYNLFLEQILSLGNVEDVATKRLNAYSGESYFAPGYVNQFKNLLLPLIVAFIGTRYYFLKKKSDLFLFLIFLPLSLIFILGTGQRAAFVIASLISLIFVSVSVNNKVKKKILVAISSIILILFSISTFFLNRGNETNILGAIEGLLFRIFSSNQESAIVGFRYIYEFKDIQYGMDWLTMFTGLLPGITVKGSIANEIFAYMYGSLRGTAPLSNWGSIYYNFGIVGCIVMAFLIGFFLEYLYSRFKSKQKTLFRSLYYVAFFVLLGSWIAGDPTAILNKGLPILIIVVILYKLILRPVNGISK